jgi:hypothetical protein
VNCSKIYSQSKEKFIPIVKYNPHDFIHTIRNSFNRLPHTDYIKVESNNRCFLNSGKGEEEIYNTTDFGFKGLNSLIQADSLFLFYFVENPTLRYQGLLPINYYGVIKDNEVSFYKNDEINSRKLSLLDVINMEYGSIDKFKEIMSLEFNRNIDQNISNGIYRKDREAAINQLREDYEFYWECFPENRDETISLFFKFLDKHINYNSSQKDKIRTMVLKEAGTAEPVNTIWLEPYYNHKKVNLMGRDISYILLQVLTEDQFIQIITKDEIRKYLKRYYIFNSDILSKPRYKIDNGDTMIPSEQDQFEYRKNLVFGR